LLLRVAGRSATANRFSPVLEDGGRPTTTSPRTRTGGLTGGTLHGVDYFNEIAEQQKYLQSVFDEIHNIQ